ncbi:MAG: phosphotransferase [Gammaproteobacteria bacterium]|nr:phosphotransferase [Gammaproteobacteria bacterium]MBT4810342.1 phosphotransferase [Thiotrichales bacterium]
MDQRLEQLEQWIVQTLPQHFPHWGDDYTLAPASADASFRRYFRLTAAQQGESLGESLIVMDAPPEKEDSAPFVAIAETLQRCGVQAPALHAVDLQQGFMLLSDLGSTPYLNQLNAQHAEQLYGDAMEALLLLQQQWPATDHPLPAYDHALLMREMELFREWYLQLHRDYPLSVAEQQMLDQQFTLLSEVALSQPRVAVHRDYHSRNLMVTRSGNPGVIDFQDAVWGPITYDLVSLLRDCYIDWPQVEIERWTAHYHQQLIEREMISATVDQQQFTHWFDWMGVQRHLKAIGIFARLNHRDGKPGYLNDIPRTLNYVAEVSGRYPELAPLYELTSRLL